MNASATALSKPTMKALRLISDWDDFPPLRPVVPDGSLRCGSNVLRELFLLCIRSLTLWFSAGVSRWPSLWVSSIHLMARPNLPGSGCSGPGSVWSTGALAKVEVVEAMVNIIKSQMFNGLLGNLSGQ